MDIRIKETGELKELECILMNGYDYAEDIYKNAIIISNENYDRESGEIKMDQENYDWWYEYFSYMEADDEEIQRLAEEFNIEDDEIYTLINEELSYGDFEYHHEEKQQVLERIRIEYSEYELK